MTQMVDAVYEHGVFRPLRDPHLAEGQSVQLIVTGPALDPDKMLALARSVYDGLSQSEIDEIERVALDRENFFDMTDAAGRHDMGPDQACSLSNAGIEDVGH